MSRKVTIQPYNLTFVGGYVTGGADPGGGAVECGEGTPYPLLVTTDQLAEILYRVKDAWPVAGEVSHAHINTTATFSVVAASTLARAGGAADPAEYSLPYYSYKRGFVIEDAVTLPHAYLGAPYSAVIGIDYSGGAPYGTLSDSFVDAADDELALWCRDTAGADVFKDVTAFNLRISANAGTTGAAPPYLQLEWVDPSNDAAPDPAVFYDFVFNSFEFTLQIFHEVAFVNADSSGDPMSPANPKYLKLNFEASGTYMLHVSSLGSSAPDPGMTALQPCDLVLELAGAAQVRCPLYFYVYDPADRTVTGTDFVWQAKEWWPYVKPNGTPAWDAATGLPL